MVHRDAFSACHPAVSFVYFALVLAFSMFSMHLAALVISLGCGFYVACGWAAGGLYWRYYPTVRHAAVMPLTVSFQLAYLALCLTPVILDRREERIWKHLQSEN